MPYLWTVPLDILDGCLEIGHLSKRWQVQGLNLKGREASLLAFRLLLSLI
jgi:hypothetical protein